MLTLYYAPDNASMVLRLALEEAALPYETILVDRAAGAQRSAAYLSLNPTGKIPTLITPEGPLAETAACLLWISDAHPATRLGPGPRDTKRGAFLRWLFFLSNSVHADLIRVFYPHRIVPKDAIAAHHEMMAAQLDGHLRVLDDAISTEPELFAPPSALALYLGPMLRWAALYPRDAERWLDLARYPAIRALILALEARPSVKAAIAAEGLGETPFSNPSPPTPPEGSAI
ncbi:MAG: glutathione S-transferase family protein [Pseudomonadota bacterium]